jgi:hypothetical protein
LFDFVADVHTVVGRVYSQGVLFRAEFKLSQFASGFAEAQQFTVRRRTCLCSGSSQRHRAGGEHKQRQANSMGSSL